MKYKIVYSTKFKKDIKRYKHDTTKMTALYDVARYLADSGRVPEKYHPHKLHGKYEGSMECHIENDFLLIWVDDSTGTVWLERLGTHHELFGL